MSEDQLYIDYTNELLLDHLLLSEDHFLKYADKPDEQCLSCLYWHGRKLRAYTTMECPKFEGADVALCGEIADFADRFNGSLENLDKEKALTLAKEARDLRYRIAAPDEQPSLEEAKMLCQEGLMEQPKYIVVKLQPIDWRTVLRALQRAKMEYFKEGSFRLVDALEELIDSITSQCQVGELSDTAPYARQVPKSIDVFKTTIAKHYLSPEDIHEGSIRVVKPKPDVLVYLCCRKEHDWNPTEERCSPNPSVYKTIVPNEPEYMTEVKEWEAYGVPINYREHEVGVEPTEKYPIARAFREGVKV